MKLLITGGAGFIGSNFVHYWSQHHPADELVVFDALTYAGNVENLESVKEKITFIKGDICDAQAVEQALVGVHAVVHFAAETHVDRSITDPDLFVKTNVLGTNTLLRKSKEAGVQRFHHISTDEVFGSIPLDSNEVWTEQSPYNPRSPYSASKAASDHLVRAYHTTYGLPVTISNCANNYGPYLYPEKLLSLAITNVLEGKQIPVYTPGNQVREWLYVEDHCSAIDAILTRGKIGETYFIGPNEPHSTNMDLIKKLVAVMGVGEDVIRLVPDRPGHDQKYALATTKIQNELGWQPQFTLEKGLRAMVEWFTANEAWWKKIKNGEYRAYYEQQYGNK